MDGDNNKYVCVCAWEEQILFPKRNTQEFLTEMVPQLCAPQNIIIIIIISIWLPTDSQMTNLYFVSILENT